MTVRRVNVPATPEVSWVVVVPEVAPGETRPASPADARRLAVEFAADDCPGCARFVERAMRALALAFGEADDDWPPREGPTD